MGDDVLDRTSAATSLAGSGSATRRGAVALRSPVGGLLLLALLIVLAVVIQVVLQLPGAGRDPQLRQVTTLAPASVGWGPLFVDSLDRPARVNPCLPMGYAVNLAGAPPGAVGVVKAAVSSLAAASGLRFAYAGLTDDRPQPARSANNDGGRSPLLIAWSIAGERQATDGVDRAGVTYTRAVATSGGPVIVGADILITVRTPPANDPGLHAGLRLVLLHELGHAVGLRHVDLVGQVMSAVEQRWLSEYGSGDRLGLHHLGSGGCLPRA